MEKKSNAEVGLIIDTTGWGVNWRKGFASGKCNC